MSRKIAIVDYGLGNIFSINQALLSCGADVLVTDSAAQIESCDGILLPGVGAFADAMGRLVSIGLDKVLINEVARGKPLLGVCLGLQLLFDKSYEFGETPGLGIIKGEIVKFPDNFEGHQLSIPFIGWNSLKINDSQKENFLLSDIKDGEKFYFVHSYHAKPKDETCVIAYCDYLNYTYPAIIQIGNVAGIQGHPEKSAQQGLLFYKNWLKSLGV